MVPLPCFWLCSTVPYHYLLCPKLQRITNDYYIFSIDVVSQSCTTAIYPFFITSSICPEVHRGFHFAVLFCETMCHQDTNSKTMNLNELVHHYTAMPIDRDSPVSKNILAAAAVGTEEPFATDLRSCMSTRR